MKKLRWFSQLSIVNLNEQLKQQKSVEAALSTFKQIHQHGFTPNSESYFYVIKSLSKERLTEANAFFDRMLQLKIVPSVETFNLMIDAKLKQSPNDALKLSEDMQLNYQQPNKQSLELLLMIYSKKKNVNRAMQIYNDILTLGAPTMRAINALLAAICKSCDSERLSFVLEEIKVNGYEYDTATYNNLIHFYGLTKDKKKLVETFQSIPQPNQVSFALLFEGLETKDLKFAKKVLDSIPRDLMTTRIAFSFLRLYQKTGKWLENYKQVFGQFQLQLSNSKDFLQVMDNAYKEYHWPTIVECWNNYVKDKETVAVQLPPRPHSTDSTRLPDFKAVIVRSQSIDDHKLHVLFINSIAKFTFDLPVTLTFAKNYIDHSSFGLTLKDLYTVYNRCHNRGDALAKQVLLKLVDKQRNKSLIKEEEVSLFNSLPSKVDPRIWRKRAREKWLGKRFEWKTVGPWEEQMYLKEKEKEWKKVVEKQLEVRSKQVNDGKDNSS